MPGRVPGNVPVQAQAVLEGGDQMSRGGQAKNPLVVGERDGCGHR